VATLVDEAAQLAPAVEARAAEIEAARRLPRDLVDDLAAAGLFHGLVPSDLGGRDRGPVEVALAVERLAQADASTAWCTMIGATTALVAGRIDPGVAKQAWGDGRSIAGGTLNPAGRATWAPDAGVELDGRWSWLSGSWHCDWFVLGCVVDGTEVRHCLVPAADLELHDVWDVVGLCGTASNDGSVSGLRVPPERVLDLAQPPADDHPLATIPIITAMAPVLAAVATGTARGALDDLVELAGAKVPYQSRTVLADRSHLQVGLARAEAGLRSARSFLLESLGELWEDVVAGRAPTMEQRGLVRLASTHAVEASVAAVDAAWLFAGGSAISRTGTLQRRFRDVHAVTQHVLVAPPTWQMAGRALVGRLDDNPFTV
jgi:alkylation response protein AidB-like acyl-CoA dehydrogenase